MAKKPTQKDVTNDFQTPPEVCDYMTSLIQPPNKIEGEFDFNLKKFHFKVFEPTPGIGNLALALRKRLFDDSFIINEPRMLIDICECKNFFDPFVKTQKFDYVVMNPPFTDKSAFGIPPELELKGMKLGYYILTECMKMSDNVIALMPWFTLSDSDVRMRFLKQWGIKSLTALPRKTFQYARIQTVVIELQKGYEGETIFKTLNF